MEQASIPTRSNVLAAIQGGGLLALVANIKFPDLHSVGAIIAEIHNEGGCDAIAFFDDFDWPAVAARQDHMNRAAWIGASWSVETLPASVGKKA